MNPETFFDNFGLLADTPNGVQKLRELILQLAVQGKLVAQDENDEPVSVLLERIRDEKGRLVKKRKIERIQHQLIEIGEMPFELPKEWDWVRFEELKFEAFTGLDKPRKLQSPDYKYAYFKMNNISSNGKCNFSDITRINVEDKDVKKYRLNEGDFLFNTRNSYDLVGKTCVFKNELNEICLFNNNILNIKFIGIDPNFINTWFNSPSGKSLLNKFKSSTTNVAAIYQGKLMNYLIPLPPLAEQHRIVDRVGKLMTLCDELEAHQKNKHEAKARLNSAALDMLLTAHEPDEFAHHWQRICDNFDLLYDAPDTVGELRKAILQLAVQGKLVRQDPNDEPAAVLLERIKAEKERLVKEKKIKKIKQLPDFEDGELPYELPYEWLCGKVHNIAYTKRLSTSRTPQVHVRSITSRTLFLFRTSLRIFLHFHRPCTRKS